MVSVLRTVWDVIVTCMAIAMLLTIITVSGALDATLKAFGLPTVGDRLPIPTATGRPATPPIPTTGTSTPSTPTTIPSTPTAVPSTGGDVDAWRTALDQARMIPVATPRPAGYDRQEDFGGWAGQSKLGPRATTRDLILDRDLTGVVRDGQGRVTRGTLNDPYTGRTIGFTRGPASSGRVQVDHVVALQDAWASGARDWTQRRRVEYANSPNVLKAVDGPANEAKGEGVNLYGPGTPANRRWAASTPSIWLPDNRGARCDYMAQRVRVKHDWGLSMSEWERTESIRFLEACVA